MRNNCRWSLHFEKRERPAWYIRVLTPVICILLAFFCCGIVVAAQGFAPLAVYSRLLKNAFGSSFSFLESVLQAIPLIFCGLGVSIAFRMSLNNIGAEGQYAMGAFAATGVALFCPWLPEHLLLPGMILAGFAAGALWGVLAVLPRVTLGVSETIVTLMCNYIALLFVNYWCYGPWRDRTGNNMPYSPIIPEAAHFPTFGSSRLHTGLLLAIAMTVLVFLFYRCTTRGYQMRVIGSNPLAARYAGLKVNSNILLAMALSGGLAGLAGVTQIGGVVFRLEPDLPNGAGYTAIVIAYLSGFNPFVILLVSILFGGLTQGGFSLQIMGISSKIVTMIQGAVLLFVLGGEIFIRNRLVLVKRTGEKEV